MDLLGKGRALSWLKHTATASEIRTIPIILGKIDAISDYHAMTKLFRLFVGEDNYDYCDSQTILINTLLHKLYGSEWETLYKVICDMLIYVNPNSIASIFIMISEAVA
jgi:hypothetical protein